MHKLWVFTLLGVAAGCGRSFTAPPQKQDPLRATPGWITPAPQDEVAFTIAGGTPPYSAWATADGGPDCGPVKDPTRGWIYRACLRPSLSDRLVIQDSTSAQLEVPVTVGLAFSPDIPDLQAEPCTVRGFGVVGGKPGFHLHVVGGPAQDGGPPACADVAPLSALPHGANQPASVVDFVVPQWLPDQGDGGNTYLVEVVDQVGEDHWPNPPEGTAFTFSVQVNQPASTLDPLAADPAQRVLPGQSLTLSYAPAQRVANFMFAPDGNSSHGSITPRGVYTAGANPNTVDHVLVVEDGGPDSQVADVWIAVGNPALSEGLGGGGLWAGDVNNDGTEDLLVVSDGTSSSTPVQVVLGGATPQVLPTAYLPLHPDGLELADVNGDGLADLVASVGGGGQGSQPSTPQGCQTSTSSGCAPDGGVDPGYGLTSCSLRPDGGPTCPGEVFGPQGQYLESVGPVAGGGQLTFKDSAGDALTCQPVSSPAGNFDCAGGCVALDGGNWLCPAGFSCGDQGCANDQQHDRCFQPYGDGGYVCNVSAWPGVSYQPPACTVNPDQSLDCGPFHCVTDHRGGYACGPHTCLGGTDGLVWCNPTSCVAPAQPPEYGCSYLQDGGYGCEACGAAATVPQTSNVRAFASLLGGGFLDLGSLPGGGSALPAELDAGLLLVTHGYTVAGQTTQGGATTFSVLSGPLPFPDAGMEPAELRVAHKSSGEPWAVFQSGRVQGTSDQRAAAWVMPGGGSGARALQFPPNVDWSGLQLVDTVAFAPGEPETAVLFDFGQGGVLHFIEDASSSCAQPLHDEPFAQALGGGTPSAALPLPAAHAIAVEFKSPLSPLATTWVLIGRTVGACDVHAVSWASVGLPQLDGAVGVQALASGDFTGDGVGDLAVGTVSALAFYPGSLEGRFGQGDVYGLDSPVVGLSAGETADGGIILASLHLLDARVELFRAANNAVPGAATGMDVTFASHLAYGASWPEQSGLGGVLMRGTALWTVGRLGDGGLELTPYPDPDAPDHPGAPTELDFTGGMTPADLFRSFIADRSRSDAAWLALVTDDGAVLRLVHLVGTDGGIAASETVAVPLGDGGSSPPRTLVSLAPEASGGLAYLLAEPATSALLAGTTESAGPTPLQIANFIPSCRTDQSQVVVEGGKLALLSGSPPYPADAGAFRCNASNGGGPGGNVPAPPLQEYVYDFASGTATPVAGTRSYSGFKPIRALELDTAGAPSSLLVASFGSPGLLALVHVDGGWTVDSTYAAEGASVDFATFQVPDGGVVHVLDQLQPARLQVLTR